MNKALSSRDFNQDTAAAKRAAKDGPVFITDRGQPAYVLMTIEDYRRLSGPRKSLAEALGMAEGGDIEFEPPRFRDLPREVDFD
jgi:prevent-host-death family protein